jgi:hypothetical protein
MACWPCGRRCEADGSGVATPDLLMALGRSREEALDGSVRRGFPTVPGV